jgi:hypothetical protein
MPAVANAQHRLTGVDVFEREAVEEGHASRVPRSLAS